MIEYDLDTARAAALRALDSGAAAERFAGMVVELGGPAGLLDAPSRHLPAAPEIRAVEPTVMLALVAGKVIRLEVRAIVAQVSQRLFDAMNGGQAIEHPAHRLR